MIDRHAVTLDRTDMAIFAERSFAAALHGDGLAPGWLMMIGIGIGSATIAGIGAATIARIARSVLISIGSAATPGVVSTAAIIRACLPGSAVGRSSRTAILRARLPGSAIG
jgi:hypothetical protein